MKSFLYFSEETTHFKQKLISYTAPSPPKKNCHCLISNRKDKLLFKLFQDNPLKLLYQHFVSAVNFCLFIIVDCKFSRLLFHVTRTPPWLFRPVNSELSSELYPNYFLSFVFGVVAAVAQVLRI